MTSRLSWRKGSTSRPRTHTLWRGTERLATAQQTDGGYFWYGCGVNTALTRLPMPLEQAKREALDHVREVTKLAKETAY